MIGNIKRGLARAAKTVTKHAKTLAVAGLVAVGSATAPSVHATGTVDADITQFFDNASATWTTGKSVILTIAGFSAGLTVFWLAFRRATKRS